LGDRLVERSACLVPHGFGFRLPARAVHRLVQARDGCTGCRRPLAGEKVRRNITEGKAGTPLRLRLSVLDASTCRPLKGAAVEVWHADAGGVYSGFGAGASSRTFMRGVQKTDAAGLAIFDTVYPGWYQGRTVHIHTKVHLGGNVVHTGQLFFPDAVFKRSPYNRRPNRDQRNTGRLDLRERRLEVADRHRSQRRGWVHRPGHDGRARGLSRAMAL
jgi:protocatechuate 3,4-dioxygenase beta subunit